MDKPLVLLLADDLKTARATAVLLRDWGYDVSTGATEQVLLSDTADKTRVVAIIVDLVVEQSRKAVERALATRAAIGADIPILIQATNDTAGSAPIAASRVTLLSKPVDPARINAWLDTLRGT